MSTSTDQISGELLDVVPPIMRAIRHKWKAGPIGGVTNSQFRILRYIQRKPGAALQDVARHLGLTPSTTSTTVDEMVANGLVLREPSKEDRRKITLTLTAEGCQTLEEVFEHSRQHLSAYLGPLTPEERTTVYQGLKLLAPLFSSRRDLANLVESENQLEKTLD